MGGLLDLFYYYYYCYYYYNPPHPCGRLFMEWILLLFLAIALWTRILKRIKSCALISSGGVSWSNSSRGAT